MARASILITIDPFTGPFVPPGTTAVLPNCKPVDMAKQPGSSGRVDVTPPSGAGPSYVDGVVTVRDTKKPKPISVTFVVVDTAGAGYTVCGMVLNDSKVVIKVAEQRGPHDNFKSWECDDDGNLTVEDTVEFASSNEFLLLIQNTYGGIAIIDPKIVNM